MLHYRHFVLALELQINGWSILLPLRLPSFKQVGKQVSQNETGRKLFL